MKKKKVITAGTQEMSGQGGQLPTQDLADKLTLSQPDGAGCVPYITICPPSFRLLPTSLLLNRLLRQKCNSIHFLDLNSCQMKSNSSLNCKHALAIMMARTQTMQVCSINLKKAILFANSHMDHRFLHNLQDFLIFIFQSIQYTTSNIEILIRI